MMLMFLFLVCAHFNSYTVSLKKLLTDPNPVTVSSEGILDLSKKGLRSINRIGELAPEGVTELNLDDNEIDDIAPLTELSELAVLHIAANRVRNALPLLCMPKLRCINIEGNPLSKESFKNLMVDARLELSLGAETFDLDRSRDVRGVEMFEIKPSSKLGQKIHHDGCPICQDATKPDPLFATTCFHGFHITCLDGWVRTHNTCPVCRNELRQQAAAVEGGGAAVEPEYVEVDLEGF